MEVPAEARKQRPLFSGGSESNRGGRETKRGGGFVSRAKPFDGATYSTNGSSGGVRFWRRPTDNGGGLTLTAEEGQGWGFLFAWEGKIENFERDTKK